MNPRIILIKEASAPLYVRRSHQQSRPGIDLSSSEQLNIMKNLASRVRALVVEYNMCFTTPGRKGPVLSESHSGFNGKATTLDRVSTQCF